MKSEITSQLKFLTHLFIETNFSIRQNYPKFLSESQELSWENHKNLAFTLKDSPYDEMYSAVKNEKDFNFQLLDWALVQLKYTFNRDRIIKHVLCYYPFPGREKFSDNPEEFEETYYGNKLFADIVDRKFITSPIRFDFTSDHQDLDHPKVHATLGNITSCRIAVSKPISPLRFMHFILRNFYFNKFKEIFNDAQFKCPLKFEETITKKEKQLLHFSFDD